MPRAKAQSSLAKNQMQLALALSSSLEESKKQELSKLTEELPASIIEDGEVPQNIKRMQKEFLERLQLPKPGPSKKSKKPAKPVPTLLVQSSEERLRILTEKVSLVLIKEEGILSSSKNEDRITQLQDGFEQNILWNMSWMLSSDHSLYYTEHLATFIAPSEVTMESKLNNASVVPSRLTTPVKYEALSPSDSSQLSPHSGHESYISNEANFVDPNLETRLELQNDWQKLLNNSELSDITIIVKEGSYIWAHKLVLFVRCRAAVDDLDEDNKLLWTNVTHCHALAFLEYVYSGKLTAIRMLGASIEGVLLLARMYKVTELLKHLPISDLGEEVSSLALEASDSNDCIVSSPISTPKKTFCPSPDIFDSPQRIINKEKVTTPSHNLICDYTEISSDEDMFSSCEGSPRSPKRSFLSPEISCPKTRHVLSSDLLHIEIPSHRVFEETINADVITETVSRDSSSQRTRQSSFETSLKKNHISENAEEHHSSLLLKKCNKKHKRLYIDDNKQYCKAIGENISTNKSSPVYSTSTPVYDSPIDDEKQFCKDKLSPVYSPSDDKDQYCKVIGENISTDKLSPVYSPIEDKNQYCQAKGKNISTNKLSPVYSPIDDKNENWMVVGEDSPTDGLSAFHYYSSGDDVEGYPYYRNKPSPVHSPSTPKYDSPIVDENQYCKDKPSPVYSPSGDKLSPSDHSLPNPKRQKMLSSSTNNCKNEKNLLNDSFKFDINDSVLMRQSDDMQTPEWKSSRLGQLRTPLDNVKSSNPATPMPDYGAMTDEQYQVELERYGLKKGLTRRQGNNMLTYLYRKSHPLVEVVSLDGKELYIPLGEKTPGYEVSADDKQLSQHSEDSSGDEGIMLEETIFDDEEEEDLTPGVSSCDLKTAVRTWITSQPEIHEMILSYEPIWVDSFHLELKKQFDKKIKVSQLMDVLDEEGITFRSAQGQQNRRKKQSSPKKKRVSPKKQLTSPKTK